jgi:hypothetical protein
MEHLDEDTIIHLTKVGTQSVEFWARVKYDDREGTEGELVVSTIIGDDILFPDGNDHFFNFGTTINLHDGASFAATDFEWRVVPPDEVPVKVNAALAAARLTGETDE